MSFLFDRVLEVDTNIPNILSSSDDVEESPEPLTAEQRSSAIKSFSKAMGDKIKHIKFFPKNTNKKHDRIIAELPDKIDEEKKSVIAYLNNKHKDFTFTINGKYIFANPKHKKVKENVIMNLIENGIFDFDFNIKNLEDNEVIEATNFILKKFKEININDIYISEKYNPLNNSIISFNYEFNYPIFSRVASFVKLLNESNNDYTYTYNFNEGRANIYAYKKEYNYLLESNTVFNHLSYERAIIDTYAYNTPLLAAIMSKGYPAHIALEMLIVAICENPYYLTYITPACVNESIDEVDDLLFFSFLEQYKASNLKVDKITEIANNDLNVVAESIIDSAKKTVSRNVDKIKTHIKSGRLSPIISKLKDALEEITGLSEKKKQEMVISGNGFIKLRRIYFKALIYCKSMPVIWAILPGGFVGFALKIIAAIVGMGKVKSEIKGEDDGTVKRKCIAELETELKMTREKINDAKAAGDKKAKYQLMRLEGQIEGEINRIRHGDPINKRHIFDSYNKIDVKTANSKLYALYENLETTKKHVLPIDLSKFRSKNSRVMCLNTTRAHTIVSQTIPAVGILGALGAATSAAIVLPSILVILGFTGWLESNTLTAVDFIPVNKDMKLTNELKDFPVISINDGIVVESVGDSSSMRYSNFIIIDHNGFFALYGFINGKSIKVKKGDKVRRGQVIANVGSSSNALYKNNPLLHFEMTYTNIINKKAIFDPLIDIPKFRTGFIDYKCTEIGYNTALTPTAQHKDLKFFSTDFYTPMKLNTSGELSDKCFLTDLR